MSIQQLSKAQTALAAVSAANVKALAALVEIESENQTLRDAVFRAGETNHDLVAAQRAIGPAIARLWALSGLPNDLLPTPAALEKIADALAERLAGPQVDQPARPPIRELASLAGRPVDDHGTTVGDVLDAVPPDWAEEPPAFAREIVELCEQSDAADVPGRVASLMQSRGDPPAASPDSQA